MDIKGRIKEFCFKVLNKIEDHLATVVASGLILIVTILCIIFWEWVKTKHSLEMYGWMWTVDVFTLGALPIFIFWLLQKKDPKISYRKDEEILVVLENKLTKYELQKQNEILIDFRLCDRKWRFPKGSAQLSSSRITEP